MKAVLRRTGGTGPRAEPPQLRRPRARRGHARRLARAAGRSSSRRPSTSCCATCSSNARRVLTSKAQILDHVWDYDFAGDASVSRPTSATCARRSTPSPAADPHGPRRRLQPPPPGRLNGDVDSSPHDARNSRDRRDRSRCCRRRELRPPSPVRRRPRGEQRSHRSPRRRSRPVRAAAAELRPVPRHGPARPRRGSARRRARFSSGSAPTADARLIPRGLTQTLDRPRAVESGVTGPRTTRRSPSTATRPGRRRRDLTVRREGDLRHLLGSTSGSRSSSCRRLPWSLRSS